MQTRFTFPHTLGQHENLNNCIVQNDYIFIFETRHMNAYSAGIFDISNSDLFTKNEHFIEKRHRQFFKSE